MPEVSKPISSWKSPKALLLASLGLCAAPCGLSAAATNDSSADRPEAKSADLQPMLLMIDINQQKLNNTALILRGANGELYASENDLQTWRVQLPAALPVSFRGSRFYPLASLPGMNARLDEATQSLYVEVRPETFASTGINANRTGYSKPIPPSPGMFFNYDLLAERPDDANTHGSGLFELGGFSAFGSALTTFAVVKQSDGQSRSLRLDTTFTVDQPQRLASFRVGDTVSRAAAVWGRAVRFGGVQYSTNFATQPGLITFPIQSFSGQAALPSTVDVYVNNILATRKDVAPGPFSITDLPVVSGSGDVNIVVRDFLGREQALTQPFYASPSLLRQGLKDFSFESGALRENYGILSSDYGARFAAGTYRAGMTDAVTGEAHVEWQEDGPSAAGLNVLTLFPSLGTLSTAAAASRSDDGNGHLWAVGFDRQSRLISFGVRTQLASANFRQLGSVPGFPAPRRLTSANLGLLAGDSGSFGAAYVRQETPGAARVEVASLSYSLSLRSAGLLGVSAFKTLHGAPNRSISVFWAMPLGRDVSVSANHIVSESGPSQTQLTAQRNLPSGEGYGYRLQTGRNVPHQGALQMQNRVGTYMLEAATFEGRSSTRAGMAGGIAALGGSAFLSRRIADSFGLVQLPGMDKVRVYVDNQEVARTDADGNALLPRLRPYDNNPVRIEHMDLRMDTEIRSLTANPVPYSRTGVVIRFPIQRSRGALMKLVSDDGTPLPPGTEVGLEGEEARFQVAMDGAVYVTGLKDESRLRATAGERVCGLDVRFKESASPIPHLGTLVCKGERP
jgi:outer membrane usher protein